METLKRITDSNEPASQSKPELIKLEAEIAKQMGFLPNNSLGASDCSETEATHIEPGKKKRKWNEQYTS